jgi:hypothetical protein
MIIKSKHSGYAADGTRTPFFGGGGGGGGPNTTTGTTYQTNIPEYASPYVMNMLGATQKQLFQTDEAGDISGFRPYQPYSTNVNDYVAPFSPLQQQAMQSTGQLQTPGQFAPASNLAMASGIGSYGAGQQYLNQMQDPASMKSFMNPYQQGVTDVAKNAAVREAQMAQNASNLGAARQGTYGGARQTLANSERERNLMSNLSNIQAQGSNQAYNQAVQNQQFGANLGMQGYGQAGQAASTLGGLGSQQLGAQKDIIGMQSQLGQQQQAAEQQKISQSIQDWANTQQYPLMQLGVMSNMLRGLPMQSQTTNQYVAAPNPITQGIGLAGAGASIFNALKREGGVIKENKMASGGIAGYNVGGSIRSKLYDMDANDIQAYIKESSSPAAREIAEEVLRDKTGKAGGGIIAFNEGDTVKEDPEMVRQAYIEAARIQAGNPPMLETSKPYKPAERYMPLTERIGRAIGIKDAGRQVPTKETTTMPMRPDGSDVPMVAGSPELAAAQAVPVNPRSIAAAAPAPVAPSATLPPMPANVKTDELGRADATKQSAAPVRAPAPTPTAAAPSNKIMPTAGVKGNNAPFGIAPPVDPDTGKSIAQLAEEKATYVGPNTGAEQNRANLMAERANAKDEARRAQSLRMAEFFGAWGSTPGNTIVAGLNALKNKVPDFISDMKEESKIRRAIDKDIAELDKIDRLEKAGNFDEAAKRKDKLSKEAYDVWGKKVDAASHVYTADASVRAAGIRASVSSGGGEGAAAKNLNQAVTRYQTEDKNISAEKKGDSEYKLAIAKLTAKPDDAKSLGIKNKKEAAWNDRLSALKEDVDYYKKKQGREVGETKSSDSAPGTAGNPIKLK